MRQPDKEFSKRQVVWSFVAFWVQLAASVVILLFRPDLVEAFLSLMTTTATLTGAVHLGYFGKAGVENYRKIHNAFERNTDDEEAEG